MTQFLPSLLMFFTSSRILASAALVSKDQLALLVEPNDVALEHFEEGLVLSNIMAHRTRGKEKNMLGLGNRSSRVND